MSGASMERLSLEAVTSSPASARRWITAQLASCSGEVIEVASLLTTELVTNAVLHAKTPVQVTVERRSDRVRVEVADQSPIVPTTRRYGAYAGTGRGLTLVEAMSSSWGVEAAGGGKVVFFDLMLSESPGAEATSLPLPAFEFDLDDWPDLEHERGSAGPPGTEMIELVLLAMPLARLRRASEQYDTLAREFALILDQSPAEREEVPGRLLALMEDISRRFGSLADASNNELQAALSRGDEQIDLTYRLPADVGVATLEYDALLDEADAYCRAGALLTVAATPEAVAVRKWFLLEFVAQAAGQPPVPWPESPWALSLGDAETP